MRIGIDAHMLEDHSGGNESYYTNILKNMYPDKDMELYLFIRKVCPLFYVFTASTASAKTYGI